MPNDRMKKLQDNGEFTELFMLSEEVKTLPFGLVWDEFCKMNNMPSDEKWYDEVKKYEQEVLSKR